jgi:hypothetical protein
MDLWSGQAGLLEIQFTNTYSEMDFAIKKTRELISARKIILRKIGNIRIYYFS